MEIDKTFEKDLNIAKINKDFQKTLLCAWILKDFIVILVLSFVCQAFYTAIGDAEAYCLHLLAFNKNPDVKRFCKNILRLNQVAFRKMHAYGLYLLDPKLLLSIITSVTAYAVVIIQFELIK
nr:uncharacterized protein LOC113392041 [Vanessa tameamea]